MASQATGEQLGNAAEIDRLALALGIKDPGRRHELIGAAYQESGLREGAVNPQSGAFGLFQLLSSGYQRLYRANIQAGQNPVDANINAILPNYLAYWQQHPNASVGEAAAAIEASGEPPSWYASGFQNFLNIGGGAFADAASFRGQSPGLLGSGTLYGAPGALENAPGVSQTVGAVKSVAGGISSVEDAIKFVFTYRFLEILGGGALVLLGVVGLMREVGISAPKFVPNLPAPSESSLGTFDLEPGEREAARRTPPAREVRTRRPAVRKSDRPIDAGTDSDRRVPQTTSYGKRQATGDDIPF